jgi:hypothetical protein
MHSLRNIVSRVPRMTCRPKQEPTASSENTRHGSVHTCALVCVTGLGTPNQDRYGRCMRHGHAHCNNCQQLRVLRASGQFGPLCSARPSQFTRATESIQCTCARVAATKHTHKRKPTHCTDPRRCAPRLHGGDCTGGEGGQPTPGRISDCMTCQSPMQFLSFLGPVDMTMAQIPRAVVSGFAPWGPWQAETLPDVSVQ